MVSLQDDLNTFHLPRKSRLPVSSASESDVMRDDEPAPPAAEPAGEPEIDLSALANKVYALLKQELRVELERLGRYGN